MQRIYLILWENIFVNWFCNIIILNKYIFLYFDIPYTSYISYILTFDVFYSVPDV